MYPWPTTAGTDTFSHLAVVNQIIHDHGTSHFLASYPFIFHSILATLSLLSGANPLFVISNIYPFVYPYSLLLSFLLIFFITKNEVVAFFSTILTLSIYEHGGYLATYLPFPSSIAFIFLYTSFVACFILPSSKYNIVLIVAPVIITILMYPSAIFVSIPLIAYLLIKQGHLTERLSLLYKAIFGAIIIGGLSLIVVFYVIFPLAMISIPEIQIVSIIVITNNLDNALLHFTLGYSIIQAIAIICGLAISWIKVSGFKRFQISSLPNTNFGVIALMGTAYLIVLFSPMRYTHRTELYLRPFYMLLIVLVAYIASMAIADLLHLGDRIPGRKSIAIVLIMVIILVPISYEKTQRQANYLLYGETRTPTSDEMIAFTWIAEQTVPGDYILTDMATGFIIRGVVFRNASTSFTLDGESRSPNSFTNLSQRIFDFFNATEENLNLTYSALLEDSHLLNYTSSIAYIVVSPRTNMWISRAREGRLIRTASYEYALEMNDSSWSKFNSTMFDLVYSVGDVRVLTFNIGTVMNHNIQNTKIIADCSVKYK